MSFGLGNGFEWVPLAMLAGLAFTLAISLFISAAGKSGFSGKKEKALPFYSGNIPGEKERMKASDYFWGFSEALSGYYEKMEKMHSGNPNDLAAWFVAVAALALIALSLGAFLWA